MRDYINLGLSKLHDMLMHKHEDMLWKQVKITTSSGEEKYRIADDFYMGGPVFVVSGNARYELDKFHPSDLGHRSELLARSGAPDRAAFLYRFIGKDVWLFPKPEATTTLEVWYIPESSILENDEDELPDYLPSGWESYAELDAAIALKIKEDVDPSFLVQERELVRQRIERYSVGRDGGRPDAVRDINSRFRHRWF